jgi:hypothetical protein
MRVRRDRERETKDNFTTVKIDALLLFLIIGFEYIEKDVL